MEISDYIKKYTDGGFFKTDRITWDVPAADDFFKSASESMKMRHLPEYDHVIAWMQSNKGSGMGQVTWAEYQPAPGLALGQ